MKNKISQSFNKIKANNHLKQNTYKYLLEKIEGKQSKKALPFKRLSLAIVIFILAIAGSFHSYGLYTTEAAYLDIDVNPSIELTLNHFDQVINAYAYNAEGKRILNEVNLKNKSYKDALTELIAEMKKQGYVDNSGLLIATLQLDNAKVEKAKLKELQAYIDKLLQTQKIETESEVYTVDSTTKSHSHEENLTPAKYLAIIELKKVDPEATFENCRDHSISEIEDLSDEDHSGNTSGNHSSNSTNNGSSEDSNSSGNKHDNKPEHSKNDETKQSQQHEEKSEKHNQEQNETPKKPSQHNSNNKHGGKH